MVEAGAFRQDLFYRLSVFDIDLPALRDRISDLELLIQVLLKRLGKSDFKLTPNALRALRHYSFPGNIRELRNIIERATLLADEMLIHTHHLPARCQPGTVSAAPDTETIESQNLVPLDEAENRYLRHALATHDGDRKSLAEKLGISERALYRKLSTARINR